MRDFILRHKNTIISNNVAPEKNDQSTTKKAQEKGKKPIRQKTDSKQLYIVKPGDTLYKISKEFYGTPKFYKLIMEANRTLLNSSAKLIPGYKLTIPPTPKP